MQREKRTSTPSKRGRGCHLEENSQVMGGRSCQNSSQPLILVNFISTIPTTYHHPNSPQHIERYKKQLFISNILFHLLELQCLWPGYIILTYIFFPKSYHPSIIYSGLWDLYCHIAGFFGLYCRRTHHLTSKLPWNVCDKSSVSVLSTRLEVFPRVCPI